MAERLAELCAKAAAVPQYCEYGACGPMQRRVSATLGTGSCRWSLCWGVQLGAWRLTPVQHCEGSRAGDLEEP